jgi:hypothetical protein
MVIVGGWYVTDYIGVNQPGYPARIHDNEWLVFVLPVEFLACVCLEMVSRQRWSFLLPAIATVIAIPLSVPLNLIFRIWFHFSTKGSL